jgi:hypothetical protein
VFILEQSGQDLVSLFILELFFAILEMVSQDLVSHSNDSEATSVLGQESAAFSLSITWAVFSLSCILRESAAFSLPTNQTPRAPRRYSI